MIIITRFFINALASAEILHLPVRFIQSVWEMLSALNSTTKMIDVASYEVLAKRTFQEYVEVSLFSCLFAFVYYIPAPDPPPPAGPGSLQEDDGQPAHAGGSCAQVGQVTALAQHIFFINEIPNRNIS